MCNKCSTEARVEGSKTPREKMREANPKWKYCPYCGKRINKKHKLE